MPLYNFQRQFAELVEAGIKRQTIRPRGKRPAPAVGQIAHCYTGARTKQVRKLDSFPIVSVQEISIYTRDRRVVMPDDGWAGLGDGALEQLARADGFASVDSFFAFFGECYGGTLCNGFLIKW